MEATLEELKSILIPFGFECHPFLIGWYNDRVGEKFQLDFTHDTLAFVVLSQPSMFEKSFLPFLLSRSETDDLDLNSKRDPLDLCMIQTMQHVTNRFPSVKILHDFELRPNRRPKVLVQTAAHVSGSVTFFREDDVQDKDMLKDIKSPKIYPVCIHPDFGGWFAIRAVIVFEGKEQPDLIVKPSPVQLNQEEISRLLRLYNDNWRDWSFRDIIPPKERYSDLQKEYFETKPAERDSIVLRLKNEI